MMYRDTDGGSGNPKPTYWPEAIERARLDGGFSEIDESRAREWDQCATQEIFGKDLHEVSFAIERLGQDFYDAIANSRALPTGWGHRRWVRKALRAYKQIERLKATRPDLCVLEEPKQTTPAD